MPCGLGNKVSIPIDSLEPEEIRRRVSLSYSSDTLDPLRWGIAFKKLLKLRGVQALASSKNLVLNEHVIRSSRIVEDKRYNGLLTVTGPVKAWTCKRSLPINPWD